MANKIEHGISNLHIGTYTVSGSTVTLGTPYHQKGAVSFSIEEASNENNFYADNRDYWSQFLDGKISGDLTVAKFDEEFKKQFLGYRELTNGGLAKVKNATKPNVYIAFQFEGDAEAGRIIFYSCALGAIKREYTTDEENITPNTESIPVSVIGDPITSVPYCALRPGQTGYDTLFTTPTAPEFVPESE